MNTNITQYVRSLNRRNFTNNVQRALFTLINSNGWVSRGSVRVPSATSRMRDLRKAEYGGFEVVCARSTDLGRTGTPTTFYRLNTNNLSLAQVRRVFEGV